MKMKIVVVVDSKSGESYKEMFEGTKLVATTLGDINNQILEVHDGDRLLSQFSEWTYWRYIE